MKKYAHLLFIGLLLFATACDGGNTEESNENGTTDEDSVAVVDVSYPYTEGEAFDKEGALSVVNVDSLIGDQDSIELKLSGEIVSCCQKKGCWMNLKVSDETTMKVTFKDYGFFVPKNADGKTAYVNGKAYWSETSVEMLRHYAADEGKPQEEIDAITEPIKEITFVASGVIIEDADAMAANDAAPEEESHDEETHEEESH